MTRVTLSFSIATLAAVLLVSSTEAAFVEVAEGTDDANIGATGSFGSTPKANAVDGDPSTPYASNTSGNSFWRISLGQDHEIERVVLWGRDHGTLSVRTRTNNITIEAREAVTNNVLWTSPVLFPWDGVDTGTQIDPGFGAHEVFLPPGLIAENLVIRKTQNDGLSDEEGMGIGEFQVWAEVVPEPSSLLLVSLGCAALAFNRRRRSS